MPSQSRKHRGNRSAKVAADWFKEHGWPHAEPVGAGRPGVDILGLPGLAPEVKARTRFEPLAWLKQAAKERSGLPFVIMRCNGQGEANVGQWGVMLTLEHFTELLRESGYGTFPLEES